MSTMCPMNGCHQHPRPCVHEKRMGGMLILGVVSLVVYLGMGLS